MERLRMRQCFAIFLLALLLATASCATATAHSRTDTTPTVPAFGTLHVTRRAVGNFPPFAQRTITDPTSVRQLYKAIQALPHPDGKHASCPIDWMLRYVLDFSGQGSLAVHIEAEPFGCQDVILPGDDYRQANDSFWTLFAQVLSVPKASLFVGPRPSRGP